MLVLIPQAVSSKDWKRTQNIFEDYVELGAITKSHAEVGEAVAHNIDILIHSK